MLDKQCRLSNVDCATSQNFQSSACTTSEPLILEQITTCLSHRFLFSTGNIGKIIFALLTCEAMRLKWNWLIKSLTWFPLFPWDICSFLERKWKWNHIGTKRCAKGHQFPSKTFWLLGTPECWGISINSQLQAYPAPVTGSLRWAPWCPHPQPRLPTAQLWKSGVLIHSTCPLIGGF